jgi:predicted transcriptional regulator
MKQLFIKNKPSSVLLLLKDSQQTWYPSKLARASNSSYVHAVNLLVELRKRGVVSVEKKGRQNLYRLTEKGAYLALALDDFVKKCESFEQEQRQAKADAEKQASVSPQPPQQAQAAQSAAMKAEKPPEAEKK